MSSLAHASGYDEAGFHKSMSSLAHASGYDEAGFHKLKDCFAGKIRHDQLTALAAPRYNVALKILSKEIAP